MPFEAIDIQLTYLRYNHMKFEDFGLNKALIKAVRELHFIEATPIQEKIIPEIMGNNTDIIGIAQTGTGKTAAFGLPMIHLIDFTKSRLEGVVICPTRELCVQISNDFKSFGRFQKMSKVVPVYGGAGIENQIRQIKSGAQIIVATPGRLLDLINRKVADLSGIRFLVLDEADEMLNMGFKEDLDRILEMTPDNKRTFLFSATMPDEVAKLAHAYMNCPIEISTGGKNRIADNIRHVNYIIREKDRYPALKRIIDFYPDIYGLVFCRTRKETHEVAEKLIQDGYNSEALHGDLSQAQRDNVMRRFRDKRLQLLVATDVAARGLDITGISHVIHYNLPDEPESYTHRSGRTARAGKSGTSMVLMNVKENAKLSRVEKTTGVKFTYARVPAGEAICERQLLEVVNKMVSVDVDHDSIDKFLQPAYDTLAGLTREELIQRFVSLEFNRFIDYYRNTDDINAKNKTREKSNSDKGRPVPSRKSFTIGKTQRFFINVGRLDKIDERAITRLVCDRSGIAANRIGKIELLREFSFFEIEKSASSKVLRSMKGAKMDGRQVSVQFAEKKPPASKRKSDR